jgi:drug/metabolite transporter (DMT)-like permease
MTRHPTASPNGRSSPTAGSPPAPPSRALLVLAFTAIYGIWGSTYLGIKFAVETLPPLLMAGTRFVLAGAVLYVWSIARGTGWGTARQWRGAAFIGACLLLGGNGLVSWAEQRVDSGVAALIIALTPLFMVGLEWLAPAGRRPSATTALGLIVGVVGVAILVNPMDSEGLAASDPWRVGAILVACLSWSIGSIYSRHSPHGGDPFLASAQQMLLGGTWLVLVGSIRGEWSGFDPVAVSPRSWAAFVYLTVFGSLVAFTAYVWLLKVSSPARVSTYAFVNPVVAVFLGWALASEAVSLRLLLGAATIVGAVALITRVRNRGPAA